MKFIKWFTFLLVALVVSGILFIRLTRQTDQFIYKTSNTYENFKSDFQYREMFMEMDDEIRIHAVLFKPEGNPIGSIFHHLGNGMTLPDAQRQYKPLLGKGFQVFAYERRGFAKSTGTDDDSQVLKRDALQVFDQFLELEEVVNTPVVLWGQSLGGAFATMNAAHRQDKIQGLIVEGTFSAFPDIGKFYAHVLGMEKFKWLMPLIMNNDFPAEKNIQNIEKPVVVIHSTEDDQVPFELGQQLYHAADPTNTEFWEIHGGHIQGLKIYEDEYVEKFSNMIN